MLLYQSFHFITKSFLKAFNDTFFITACYNAELKKITRIFEAFVWSIIYEYSIMTVFMVAFSFTVPVLTQILFEYEKDNNAFYYTFLIKETRDAMYGGAWSISMQLMTYIIISFLSIEQKTLFAILIEVPGFAFAIYGQFYNYEKNGDNANYWLPLVLGDAITAFFVYGLAAFFGIKYYNLYKSNKGSKDNEKAKLSIAADELRASMIEQLEKNEDQDVTDEEVQRRKQPGKVFNKDLALLSSKQFSSLRESIGRNSEIEPGSISRTDLNRKSGVSLSNSKK